MKEACRYILLLVIAILVSSAAKAQITVEWKKGTSISSNTNGVILNKAEIIFDVWDSVSKVGLAGAFIAVTDSQDTVKMVTDERGGTFFSSRFKSDSLDLIVSYIGYKAIKGRIPNAKSLGGDLSVKVLMQEEPQQLNSIIVRDNAIAMVMHGDTTIFNAVAFRTRTGDALRELLKKLPGVKIDDDKVVYLGEKIDRIIFNGDNMFGKDMKNAMDMVLADEVKSVKVYNQDAPDQPADDPDARKERVMDVHTKGSLKKVQEVKMTAGVGIIPSNGDFGKSNYLYGGGVSLGLYAAGNAPRYSGSVEGNHNAREKALAAAPSPTDNIQADITIGRDVPRKYGWNHILSFVYDKNTQNNGDVRIYVPSTQWTERVDSSVRKSFGDTKSLKYNVGLYSFKGKNKFSFSGHVDYSKSEGRDKNISSSQVDDKLSRFDKLISNNNSNIAFHLKFGWSRRFRKGLNMTSRAMITGAVKEGNGERIDTSLNTMSREWLVNSLSTRNFTPSLLMMLTKKVSSDSRLLISYNGAYKYNYDERLYTNMLTGQINLNNSTDFRQHNLLNSVTAGYRYGTEGIGLYASVDLGFKHIQDLRNEKLENVSDMTRNYFRPVIATDLQYFAGECRLKLTYSESEDIPSSTQLRPVIDDRDPLNMTAGNPELKLPVKRDVALSLSRSLAEKNIILFMSAEGTLQSNAIVSKTIYFSESTYLPEYDYTAASGSSIIMPVNINGNITGNAKFEFQKYLEKLRTNLDIGVSWDIDRDPFYMADIRHHNLSNTLKVNSGVTYDNENFSLYFYPSVAVGRLKCDDLKVYDYITPAFQLVTSLRLFDHLELSGNVSADKMFATKSDAGYSNISLELNAGWLFGKDRRCRVMLFCSDLLNNVKDTQVSETDNYTLKSWTNGLGRAFGLNFRYVLSKR